MCELVNTKGKISNIDKVMSIKIQNNYNIVKITNPSSQFENSQKWLSYRAKSLMRETWFFFSPQRKIYIPNM